MSELSTDTTENYKTIDTDRSEDILTLDDISIEDETEMIDENSDRKSVV